MEKCILVLPQQKSGLNYIGNTISDDIDTAEPMEIEPSFVSTPYCPIIYEMLLTLMRIRLGLLNEDLADCF